MPNWRRSLSTFTHPSFGPRRTRSPRRCRPRLSMITCARPSRFACASTASNNDDATPRRRSAGCTASAVRYSPKSGANACVGRSNSCLVNITHAHNRQSSNDSSSVAPGSLLKKGLEQFHRLGRPRAGCHPSPSAPPPGTPRPRPTLKRIISGAPRDAILHQFVDSLGPRRLGGAVGRERRCSETGDS